MRASRQPNCSTPWPPNHPTDWVDSPQIVYTQTFATKPFQEKKVGWSAVLANPRMPVTSTLFDQAHHAIERKFFAMKGFHHPRGKQQECLTGLAHVSTLMPYQRRAQHAGHCAVEVESGRVPR